MAGGCLRVTSTWCGRRRRRQPLPHLTTLQAMPRLLLSIPVAAIPLPGARTAHLGGCWRAAGLEAALRAAHATHWACIAASMPGCS